MNNMKRYVSILMATLLWGPLSYANAEVDTPRCSPWAAYLESVEGSVELRTPHNTDWIPTGRGDYFCFGDEIVVKGGRAALRMANETLVRLNTDTAIRFVEDEESFIVQLLKGAGYFLSRTPKPFVVDAPYINAAVDGTEFIVALHDMQTQVGVFEGDVKVFNDLVTVGLAQGESVLGRAAGVSRPSPQIALATAVSWGLYYPPIVIKASMPQAIQVAVEAGRMAEALAEIVAMPPQLLTADIAALGVGLALERGNVEQAEALLHQSLAMHANHTESLALKALMSLVKGQPLEARLDINNLVRLKPDNVTVLLVQSYVLQSEAVLPEALAAVEKAYQLYAANPVIVARYCELLMSLGYNRRASQLLDENRVMNSSYSRIYIIAGFVELNRLNTGQAIHYFNRAIVLDDADPQARLGLGLAHIQNGRLTLGREQMEMAVLLDPDSSILRSYLGKTYFEENRFSRAAIQYQLAKIADQNDPTPWFYSSQLVRAKNQYPQAARLMAIAIAKNDNRAVYRSRMMLDGDIAARSAGQAQIYQQLGLGQAARNLAIEAINTSPGDYYGHQALASSYAVSPRHETTRASEALQASVLQPLGAKPLPPGMVGERLSSTGSLSPIRTGLNEYDSLFTATGLRGYGTGLLGSNNLSSTEWQAQLLARKAAITAGQYIYQDSDEPENRDIDFRATDFLAQFQPTEGLQLQTQFSKLEDHDNSASTVNGGQLLRNGVVEDQGVRLNFGGFADQIFLLDAARRKADFVLEQLDVAEGFSSGFIASQITEIEKLELAHVFEMGAGWTKVGLLDLSTDFKTQVDIIYTAGFEQDGSALLETIYGESEHESLDVAKFYSELYLENSDSSTTLSVGLSRILNAIDRVRDRNLPHIALGRNLFHGVGVYFGYWEDIYFPKIPYLESTHALVFNKQEASALWSSSRNVAMSLIGRWSDFSSTLQFRDRSVEGYQDRYDEDGALLSLDPYTTDEHQAKFHLNWLPSHGFSASLGLVWEKTMLAESPFNDGTRTYTKRLPLVTHFTLVDQWSLRIAASYIWQLKEGYLNNELFHNAFTNIDASLNWVARNMPLSATLGVYNVLDEDVEYESIIVTPGASLEPGLVEFASEKRVAAQLKYSF